MTAPVAAFKGIAPLGFDYNRENYKFDNEQRWARYTAGRKMVCAQYEMFRQDVSDLASVTTSKLKIYAPIMTMSIGYCITIFVEGRSGLKFPGPPVFISGMYLQCLGVGFAFLTLGTWLAFHSALSAQIAAVQLRTRKVRVPVPTQRQLDGARKLLSGYEEQCVYDMVRLPFLMPNRGSSPEHSDDDVQAAQLDKRSYKKGGLPGIAARLKTKIIKHMKKSGLRADDVATSMHMPGPTWGVPTWIAKEMEEREHLPRASPSGFGLDGPPLQHFELVRQAQKNWWAAEAYTRVCFLVGMMHLIQSFAYWLVIHNIAELGMVWGAMICAATLSAGVWLMFRLDVLPELGGSLPVEASGPLVCAIAMAMMYTGTYTERVIHIARGVAVAVVIMQILWTCRLYFVARPSWNAPTHTAKESGGHLFNRSAACARPCWLPHAFQHVTYLVAPPKTEDQLQKEKVDREAQAIKEDPMADVDMSPWWYVRALFLMCILGWSVLLTGRIVELVMGERMIVTNPGAPPWTRIGQWNGWESGPITSKHYAHVTPMRGHFAWRKGWGPQGQQEIWPSDMFGFHPESDMHWAEEEGPEPLVGAAGVGENTWANSYLAYGESAPRSPPVGGGHPVDHDWDDSGGHRRLRGVDDAEVHVVKRPVVPAAVQWPSTLELEFLACGSQGHLLALNAAGQGAMLPHGAVSGHGAGVAALFTAEGLLELGMARGVSWADNSTILVTTGLGAIAACPASGSGGMCSAVDLPRFPHEPGTTAAVVDADGAKPLTLAVAADDRVTLYELEQSAEGRSASWQKKSEAKVPDSTDGSRRKVVSITGYRGRLLATASDGSAHQWQARSGRLSAPLSWEATAAGTRRTWHSACLLSAGKVLRLASNPLGTIVHQELLV